MEKSDWRGVPGQALENSGSGVGGSVGLPAESPPAKTGTGGADGIQRRGRDKADRSADPAENVVAGGPPPECVHCGQPCGVVYRDEAGNAFCCAGCRGAFSLIGAMGLADFYALRARSRPIGAPLPARTSGGYEHFDSPDYLGLSTPVELSDGTQQCELAVRGMHCTACAWLIENVLRRQRGVLHAEVHVGRHALRVRFDPEPMQVSRLARLLDGLGYAVAPITEDRWEVTRQENRRLLSQIAVAGFLAANAMWIAVALYAAQFSSIEPEHRYFLGLAGTALSLISVAGPGRRFLVGAWSAIRARTPHMDLPIALGLTIGGATGAINAMRGVGDVYFDSLSTLVFLLLIGRWVQHKQQEKAARSVDLMVRLTPVHAVKVDSHGGQSVVLADRLRVGDQVLVRPGESVPIDGVVLEGHSEVDRGLLTGESEPVAVDVGDAVAAGEVNVTEQLRVGVEAVGPNTRIGKVVQRIDHAAAERSPIVLLADRVGGYFVVTVAVLALACVFYWWSSGPQVALSRASALLIVACPCALALATPLAVAVAIGRSARQHVLIRDGQALQRLSGVGTMWLDKTGTLTTGRRRVTRIVGDATALTLAAGLQQHCRHSVATAILEAAGQRCDSLPADATVDPATPGGVSGSVQGHRVAVGNARFLHQRGIRIDALWERRLAELVDEALTPVLVAVDGRVALLLGISDTLREDASAVVARLQGTGWQVGILSGDHPQVVARLGRELGIAPDRIIGGADPEAKLAVVRRSRREGRRVVMVGDGANDAAALAAADVGVAMRGGAEASLLAAPVYIGSGDLRHLAWLVRGARRTQRLIYQTFAASLAYNAVAVALAWSGAITPLMAAVLMPLSSVTVVSWTFLHGHFRQGVSS